MRGLPAAVDAHAAARSLTCYGVSQKREGGLHLLPVEWWHAAAQAWAEDLAVATSDPIFGRHGVEIIW